MIVALLFGAQLPLGAIIYLWQKRKGFPDGC